MPSMTGMFQSSRTASGIDLRHWSSASRPFSASADEKLSSSRMRRATFRITALSSTTRQCFMRSSSAAWAFNRSDGHAELIEIEHLLHIEHHHEIALESVHAGTDMRPAPIEIDGICLIGGSFQMQHIAGTVGNETVKLAPLLHADRDRRRAVLAWREAEPPAEIDRRDDAAAQVEEPGDLRRRERNLR